jgi:hypothetical protein
MVTNTLSVHSIVAYTWPIFIIAVALLCVVWQRAANDEFSSKLPQAASQLEGNGRRDLKKLAL